MECIATILSIISFYPVKTLFEIDMINELFKYNPKEKQLIIKMDSSLRESKKNIKFEEQMKNIVLLNKEDIKKKGKLTKPSKLIQSVIVAANNKQLIINSDEFKKFGERKCFLDKKTNQNNNKIKQNNNKKANEKNNENFNKKICTKSKFFCSEENTKEINENKNKASNISKKKARNTLTNLTEKNINSVFYNNYVNESNLKLENKSENNIFCKMMILY